MPSGEYVPSKFIWLLDNVELVGTVHLIGVREDGGPDDNFDIIPDANYEHLIRYFRGNNPLPWLPRGEPGVMHLETYPLEFADINRYERWFLPKKPKDEQFTVKLKNGTSRLLQVGDRVRVTGRWVIDHHPEYCSNPKGFTPPEAERCRYRGLLKVGQTHTELHPFDWQNIRLVEPNDLTTCRVSMAAPLYEEQYVGDWKWAANEFFGVSGHVFIDETVTPQGTFTNYNTMVGTRINVPAPLLPDIPASSYRKLMWTESIVKLGKDMNIDDVRKVTLEDRSIDVHVTVTARTDAASRPTIHGPAQDRWIVQVDYSVFWMLAGNEISCITRETGGGGFPPAEGPLSGVGGRFPNGDSWWLRIADAVAAARNDHHFYIQQPLGGQIDVVVIGTGTRSTLGTNPRSGRTDPLLSLPLCLNPPIIT